MHVLGEWLDSKVFSTLNDSMISLLRRGGGRKLKGGDVHHLRGFESDLMKKGIDWEAH